MNEEVGKAESVSITCGVGMGGKRMRKHFP